MKAEKSRSGVTFDVTDTVLLEISTQLARMAGARTGESSGFDIDFDAALDLEDSAAPPANKRRIERG
jgi:hypothetical protein